MRSENNSRLKVNSAAGDQSLTCRVATKLAQGITNKETTNDTVMAR
jgi:hypothetical protein